ncbi:MAG: amidophosphoribosyltransferase [Chlamydiota bacterium]|nr:amidophosphoribosyltransferase [Chlamydiota bacterium]
MCGLIGIIGKEPIVDAIYRGLIHLQHRGQDAAGIFAYDPKSDQHQLYKNRGLVSQVFNSETLPLPDASWAIGHVRYTTIGTGRVEDTQPLAVNRKHTIAIAHNGNIVNYVPLKEKLKNLKTTFETTCDAEAILKILIKNIPDENPCFDDICHAVEEVYSHTFGAYSIVGIITGKGMIAFRDPWGFRPLLYSFSEEHQSHAFASETGPLHFNGFDDVEDIKPGEVIYIEGNGSVHRRILSAVSHTHCSFEYNYFAKPNAVMEKKEVYRIRSRLGKTLAQEVQKHNFDVDVVVPIPDSARPSAISLAYSLQIPLEEGFVKQNHVGRTFIMPTQYARKKALSQKLITVKSVFYNRNVILVDDSIVRGTVSRRVIELARKAGAKKIYFASTFPPIRFPCLYGIDFPRSEQLVAYGKTVEEIAEDIGADGLVYNDVEGLKEAIGMTDLCTACLTGEYPTSSHGVEELQNLRKNDITELELTCKT